MQCKLRIVKFSLPPVLSFSVYCRCRVGSTITTHAFKCNYFFKLHDLDINDCRILSHLHEATCRQLGTVVGITVSVAAHRTRTCHQRLACRRSSLLPSFAVIRETTKVSPWCVEDDRRF